MKKLSFRLRCIGVKKGKRKETICNIEIERIDYVEINDELIEKYKLLAKETANKNIKNPRDMYLIIREIEETKDDFGVMESYIPFNYKTFPL